MKYNKATVGAGVGAGVGFNNATIGLQLGATNLGFNNISYKLKIRSYSKKVVNRWWNKPSKAMPAPSTLRIPQHLLKSGLSYKEARLINDLNRMRSFSTSLPSYGYYKNIMIEQREATEELIEIYERGYIFSSDFKKINELLIKIKECDSILNNNRVEDHKSGLSINTGITKRVVDPKSGLYRKTGITKWINNNYYNKLIPKPDMLFLASFINFNYKKSSFSLRIFYLKTAFRDFYYVSLYYYKLNNTVVKSNYYLYLINTPDNILYSHCLEQIEYYYGHLYKRTARGNEEILYTSCKEYKYELVSLYHELGKRLVHYCLKYMYTQYVDHFKDLSITCKPYKKYTISVKDRNLELDFFLSFTDFKNNLIKELFDLDTADLIEYGKDMYKFTIFNIYLFNTISNKVKYYNNKSCNDLKVDSKALVNVIKPNLGYLGVYHPSRNEMNKSIVRLDLNNIENDTKIVDGRSLKNSISYDINYWRNRDNSYVKRLTKSVYSHVGGVEINSRSFSSSTCFMLSKTKKDNINTTNKSFKLGSPIFNNLNIIIRDNPINEETQIKIEKFLFDYSYISLDDKNNKNLKFGAIDYSIINPKLSRILIESEGSLIKLIDNFKIENLSNVHSKNEDDKLYNELANILVVLDSKTLVNIMYGYLLKILSSYERTEDKLNSIVDVGYNLGRDLINNYYYIMYLNAKSKLEDSHDKKYYYLSNWKSENQIILDKFEDNTVIFNIGSVLIGWMLTCNILEKKIVTVSKKEKVNIILPTKNLTDTITNSVVYNIPKKLPMIVPPKVYSNKQLGGYLLNDELTTDTLLKNKRINKELTTIKDENIIYDIVNKVSSVGYKINKDVLDFILNHSNDYLKEEMVDINYKHPLLEKTKLTKQEKTELDSFLSKKELQENILGLASVFSNVPSFYIPINLDFRGRLNCIPEYLNYQSNTMAKSLLLFSKGENFKKNDKHAIEYLKLYGAACFGLDKLSAAERLEWIDSNLKDIKDFENGVLIQKAKEKFLFIAFCFEFNRWLNCLDNHEVCEFETFLPIQLDATCNGFQHLSLLSLDPSLGLELNLGESTWNDKPKDFYNFLITSLMDHFKSELKKNKELSLDKKEGYQRLIDSNLKRHIIKKSIMTIPYNVSTYNLLNYIKENFIRIDNSEWFTTKEDQTIKLHYSDFTLLGNGLREVLEYKFPKLNLLLNYLEKVAEVCTILQIPIIWSLPSGLEVKQSYVEEDEIRIKPFFYHKNRFVLKVINKNKYNNKKQIRAFMPNLVHSLDAASLALLLDSYFNGSQKDIYTVHDCFAVTSNNIPNLLELLKLTYIKIYSDTVYLKKLNKGIIDNIKNIFGDGCFDEKTRTIKIGDNIKIEFPDINVVLGIKPQLDFNSLKKSSYILN